MRGLILVLLYLGYISKLVPKLKWLLFRYLLAAVLSVMFGNILLIFDGDLMNLQGFFYHICLNSWLGNYFASFVYAALFTCLNWAVGYILYKKKIYIKI